MRTFGRWDGNAGNLHTFGRWEEADGNENAGTGATEGPRRLRTFGRWEENAGKLHTFGRWDRDFDYSYGRSGKG